MKGKDPALSFKHLAKPESTCVAGAKARLRKEDIVIGLLFTSKRVERSVADACVLP